RVVLAAAGLGLMARRGSLAALGGAAPGGAAAAGGSAAALAAAAWAACREGSRTVLSCEAAARPGSTTVFSTVKLSEYRRVAWLGSKMVFSSPLFGLSLMDSPGGR